MPLIYLIRNRVNGKAYIGQHVGTRLDYRWREHLWHAKNGSTHPFHRAIRKYGSEAFELSALSTFAESKQDLDRQEIFYTAKYRTNEPHFGYNLTRGGWGNSGFKHRQETKDKIGNSNRGVSRGLGHPVTKETRKKISLSWDRPGRKSSMLGRHHSEKSKRKSSEAPGHRTPETRRKLKIVALAREARNRAEKFTAEATAWSQDRRTSGTS
jgi:group I intron endonuclease